MMSIAKWRWKKHSRHNKHVGTRSAWSLLCWLLGFIVCLRFLLCFLSNESLCTLQFLINEVAMMFTIVIHRHVFLVIYWSHPSNYTSFRIQRRGTRHFLPCFVCHNVWTAVHKKRKERLIYHWQEVDEFRWCCSSWIRFRLAFLLNSWVELNLIYDELLKRLTANWLSLTDTREKFLMS